MIALIVQLRKYALLNMSSMECENLPRDPWMIPIPSIQDLPKFVQQFASWCSHRSSSQVSQMHTGNRAAIASFNVTSRPLRHEQARLAPPYVSHCGNQQPIIQDSFSASPLPSIQGPQHQISLKSASTSSGNRGTRGKPGMSDFGDTQSS